MEHALDVVLYLCDVQVLLVALNSIGEVSQRRVHGAHVAQLASLRELALGLSRQQHTLFMTRQCVGVVTDSCVHMAQTAEGIGRSLKSHRQKVDGIKPSEVNTEKQGVQL